MNTEFNNFALTDFKRRQCLIVNAVNIGDGAIIGAGSIVNRDIPAGEIWGGNPARFIKKLNYEE